MGFGGFWGSKKCSFEVDDPPEARTWASVFFRRVYIHFYLILHAFAFLKFCEPV